MSNTDDNKLVKQTLAGDRKAFGQIVDRYQKMVYNAAYRITKDYDDSRDVTQTVFVTVFERLDQYRPEHRLSSWLYKIAVNEAIDVVNQRNTQVELNPAMMAPGRQPRGCGSVFDLDSRSARSIYSATAGFWCGYSGGCRGNRA